MSLRICLSQLSFMGSVSAVPLLLLIFFVQVDELVFCAGQIPLVPCTMSLVKAATSVEAQLSFSHVKKVLEAVIPNLTLAHVVQAHCYITRHRDIATIRAVWESMLKATEEEKVSRCQL